MWPDHISVWMHIYITYIKKIKEYYSNQNIFLYLFFKPEYLKALHSCPLKTIAAHDFILSSFMSIDEFSFMSTDELVTCWDILSPVFLEIGQCTTSHFPLQYLWLKFKFFLVLEISFVFRHAYLCYANRGSCVCD